MTDDVTRMLDLGPAAARVAGLAEGVRDGQFGGPTPCPELAVRNLLGHLIGLAAAFTDAGRKDLGPSTATPPGTIVPDIDDEGSWRTALPKVMDGLVATWQDPAAWEGMTQAGGVTLPAGQTGVVVLNELVVHGWDLARSTGQPYQPAPADLEACHAMLAPFAEHHPAQSPFGPPVTVPADAPLLDRVIGLTGRDPHWQPAS
ncbi:TIGR03086 family protein [Actinacidiphila yanglinensis]|uniref:TIGR03086 family protein n=1 Tax=Actinacidiphila yanglinensis TaxID=310779 RepID=A0A1H5ZZJ7_9ACTN|nr:TIGR03086 family metal-binding protein [Actinacidiphila yanglinensis]SEG40896.1 TIGR03086 family protein [Actinacidiphila yanglinensis]